MAWFPFTKLKNSSDVVVDPATEQTTLSLEQTAELLLRLLHVVHSVFKPDKLGRLRVVAEAPDGALNASLPVTASIASSQTVATVTSLSQLSGFSTWNLHANVHNANVHTNIISKLSIS